MLFFFFLTPFGTLFAPTSPSPSQTINHSPESQTLAPPGACSVSALAKNRVKLPQNLPQTPFRGCSSRISPKLLALGWLQQRWIKGTCGRKTKQSGCWGPVLAPGVDFIPGFCPLPAPLPSKRRRRRRPTPHQNFFFGQTSVQKKRGRLAAASRPSCYFGSLGLGK